jgi:hypothetical protein
MPYSNSPAPQLATFNRVYKVSVDFIDETTGDLVENRVLWNADLPTGGMQELVSQIPVLAQYALDNEPTLTDTVASNVYVTESWYGQFQLNG